MSELGELLTKERIQKLNIPEDLITYLTTSSQMKDYLYKEGLEDIEELYLYYSSFYIFDESEFSTLAVSALRRAYTLERFYYYSKKIMDTTLELESKSPPNGDQVFCIKQLKFKNLQDELIGHYISLVNTMFEEGEVKLDHVLRTFGKIEFALEIYHDDYLKDLLDSGERVLNSYLDSTKEKEEIEVNSEQKEGDIEDTVPPNDTLENS